MCFKNNLGVDLNLKGCYDDNLRDDHFLFSESVGRFIIETEPKNHDLIIKKAEKFGVNIKKIGVG